MLTLLLRSLLVLGTSLAIAYLAACLFLLWRQNRFIFFPTKIIETTPAAFNVPHEDVWLPVPTRSGKPERIHGWWIPAKGQPTGVVLYCHGNGINVGANAAQAARFHSLGFSVFLFDYRGYGRSEGQFPTETSVYVDSEIAWNYLTQTRKIPPEQIFLYGHSLGGAIALDLAIKHPDAAALIVESTFTSMRRMVDYRGGFDWFPTDLLLNHKFDSLAKVRSLQMPLLLLHGTNDMTVPAEMSQVLFQAAPQPKRLFLIEGANHNNTAEIGGQRYLQLIQQFMEQVQAQQKLLALQKS